MGREPRDKERRLHGARSSVGACVPPVPAEDKGSGAAGGGDVSVTEMGVGTRGGRAPGKRCLRSCSAGR